MIKNVSQLKSYSRSFVQVLTKCAQVGHYYWRDDGLFNGVIYVTDVDAVSPRVKFRHWTPDGGWGALQEWRSTQFLGIHVISSLECPIDVLPPEVLGPREGAALKSPTAKPSHPKLDCCGWCGGLLATEHDFRTGLTVPSCEFHGANPPVVNAGGSRPKALRVP